MNILKRAKELFLRRKKVFTILGILLVVGFIAWNMLVPKKAAISYQTGQVTKGTLVVSLSESGTVAVANRQSVTTSASGVVSEVDVKNGDSVAAGQVLAKIALDQQGQQRQQAAWANYLSAQNTLSSAQANLNTLQVTLFQTNQAFMTDRGVSNPSVSQQADPKYIEENAAWLAAEANYKNQQNVIAAAQANVSNAWLSYQQTSGTITAPSSGVIGDMTIAPGMQIAQSGNSSSATNGSNISSQAIASIKSDGTPVITVTLSELDATKVKTGQKATISFDALPNQTFIGKVIGINTTGTVSSGVTTYPATIVLDSGVDAILPNMSATANVILDVKPDVLLVPTAAVQTINGQSFVRVMQNNQPIETPVTIGESSDTQIEIVSGLTDGETIVVGTTQAATTTTASPFSSGLRGFGGGGNATFIRSGGGGAAAR